MDKVSCPVCLTAVSKVSSAGSWTFIAKRSRLSGHSLATLPAVSACGCHATFKLPAVSFQPPSDFCAMSALCLHPGLINVLSANLHSSYIPPITARHRKLQNGEPSRLLIWLGCCMLTLKSQTRKPLVGKVCADAGLNMADFDRSSAACITNPNADCHSAGTLEQRLQRLQ